MTINLLSTPSTNTCCGKELAEDPGIEASSSATNSRSFTSKQIGVYNRNIAIYMILPDRRAEKILAN